MKEKKIFIRLGIIGFACLLIGAAAFFMFGAASKNELEIFYFGKNSSSYSDQTVELFYDTGAGYHEAESVLQKIYKRHVSFSLDDPDAINSIRLDFNNTQEQFGIDKIIIRSGLFTLLEIDGAQLPETGEFRHIAEIRPEDTHIYLKADNGDLQYYFNDEYQAIIVDELRNSFPHRLTLSVLPIVMLVVLLSWWYYCKKSGNTRLLIIFSTILIVVWFFVLFMACFSNTCGHPDEDETRAAVDYYVTNWRLPNLLDPKLENVFSNYGMTRLNEWSVYYLLAGKLGFICKEIFHINTYYRMLNVLIFLWLIALAICWGKKNIYAFIPVLIAPQVWYVFSYATSDAWDFFLSYIIIGEILIDDSFLNRALRKRNIICLMGYGAVCALLLMGKANYYVVLLLAFTILFFRWKSRGFDKELFYKYMVIVAAFAVIFGIRQVIDLIVYKGEKIQIYEMAQAMHRSIEIDQQATLKDQGYSLLDACISRNFFKTSFFSLVGYYGWMNLPSANWYYVFMRAIYALIGVEMIYTGLHNEKAFQKVEFISYFGIIVLSVVLSMFRTWTVDFQPQGRYLFPALMVLYAILETQKEKISKKYLMRLAGLASVAGMYSFVVYGVLALT